MTIRSFILSLLFMSAAPMGWAQQPTIVNYTTRDGLPSNEIYNIYQDENGLLWFATDAGLCNYNGREFKTFEQHPLIPPGAVYRFYPQEDGNVWFTTASNGLFYFDPEDYIIRAYQFNETLSDISQNATSNNLRIQNGTVEVSYWDIYGVAKLGHNGEVLQKPYEVYHADLRHFEEEEKINKSAIIDKKEFFSCLLPRDNKPMINAHLVHEFENDDGGYHYIASNDQQTVVASYNNVYLYAKGKVKKVIDEGVRPLSCGFVEDGSFWVGYIDGLRLYDRNGELISLRLSGKSVTFFIEDHQGASWYSTLKSGLVYVREETISEYVNFRDVVMSDIYALNKESIYAVSKSGDIYHFSDPEFAVYSLSDEVIDAQVCWDDDNELVSVQNYHVNYNGKKSYVSFSSCVDFRPNNEVLLGGTGIMIIVKEGEIQRMHSPGRTNAIQYYESGILTAKREGLFFHPDKTRKRRKYCDELNVPVTAFQFLNNNKLIAGTKGYGVKILKNESIVDSLSVNDQLPSNRITDIEVENDTVFWIGTDRGLSRVIYRSSGDFDVANLTRRHGLLDNHITSVRLIGEDLWVSSTSGVNRLNKSLIDKVDSAPTLHLRTIETMVNGEPKRDISSLTYAENSIEFSFDAVSFIPDYPLEFRYRVIGVSDSWNYSNNNKVVLESLASGEYTVIVQAGVDGQWDPEVLKYQFSIAPPYYRTWWFLSLIILVFGVIVYLFFRLRILKYNKGIIREILRQILKRLQRERNFFIVRDGGKEIKIYSDEVYFVKSSGNYIEIQLKDKRVITRAKISDFVKLVPDPLEYIRIHRSYFVRIDKIESKSRDSLVVLGEKLQIGRTYINDCKNISL